ncbi:MAG TPA: helix-turn-helix domain-containing protein [Gemmataceae bacterium]|nr:helix-turn-helix domain-containing protein [Gemmataceae bacterium]
MIYYVKRAQNVIWMLTMYPKNVIANIPADMLREIRNEVEMAKKMRDIGTELLQGIREIKRGEHGRVINVPDVAATRAKTGLSQARFAELLGVSIRTLQDWEQGRRAPSGAARTLLMIAAKNPQALLEVA